MRRVNPAAHFERTPCVGCGRFTQGRMCVRCADECDDMGTEVVFESSYIRRGLWSRENGGHRVVRKVIDE